MIENNSEYKSLRAFVNSLKAISGITKAPFAIRFDIRCSDKETEKEKAG